MQQGMTRGWVNAQPKGETMTISPNEAKAAMMGGCGLRTLVAAEDGDPTAQALFRAAVRRYETGGMEVFRPADFTVSPATLIANAADETITESGVM